MDKNQFFFEKRRTLLLSTLQFHGITKLSAVAPGIRIPILIHGRYKPRIPRKHKTPESGVVCAMAKELSASR
jgi:hypothetical protein